jgi:hypothetical protein
MILFESIRFSLKGKKKEEEVQMWKRRVLTFYFSKTRACRGCVVEFGFSICSLKKSGRWGESGSK